MWFQKCIKLTPKTRGFHLVTDEILQQLPELKAVQVGLAHLLLQHTSASLSINENAASAVRRDMERHFNILAPDAAAHYEHVEEGPDDMPAHIKSGLLGVELTLPVAAGQFTLGVWQGIYLGEHRDSAGGREIVITLFGDDV